MTRRPNGTERNGTERRGQAAPFLPLTWLPFARTSVSSCKPRRARHVPGIRLARRALLYAPHRPHVRCGAFLPVMNRRTGVAAPAPRGARDPSASRAPCASGIRPPVTFSRPLELRARNRTLTGPSAQGASHAQVSYRMPLRILGLCPGLPPRGHERRVPRDLMPAHEPALAMAWPGPSTMGSARRATSAGSGPGRVFPRAATRAGRRGVLAGSRRRGRWIRCGPR